MPKISIIVFFIAINVYAQSNLYLSQIPPGIVPIRFASGIVTGYVHGMVAISPKGDEIYWVVNPSIERIVYSKLENGKWTEPALADFVKDYLTKNNGGLTFSPDGEKLFFYSDRTGGKGSFDAWYVERNATGWGNPINVGEPYNTIGMDNAPLFTNKGNAYHLGYTDNWQPLPLCYKYSNGKFSDPTPMDIISEYSPWWSIYVSPDEDYLIFAGGGDNADLYIRFKNIEGQWGTPINMGDKINTNEWERFPVVSPDGKYLFFTRGGSTISNLFWVSTAVIDSIKKTTTGIDKDNEQLPNRIILDQNYPNPFNPSTMINYQLPSASSVKLKIYDSLGQEIKTLVNSFQNAGEHSIVWNGTDGNNNPVSSGMYFYSLFANNQAFQKKMVLVR